MSMALGGEHGGSRDAAQASYTRTRVWDLPTRIFHWTLALSFAGAWITAESERFRDLHLMLGYTFAGMIVFRLAWGLVGSRYARFSSFMFSPRAVLRYLSSLLGRSPEHHLGHNPAGALAVFAMLGLGVMVVASGIASYQEIGGEWLEELHEGASSVMLAVVALHVAGVVVSSVLHRENLVRSMVTGWKAGAPEDGIRHAHPLVGALLLGAVIALWLAFETGAAPNWLPASNVANVERGHSDDHDDDRD